MGIHARTDIPLKSETFQTGCAKESHEGVGADTIWIQIEAMTRLWKGRVNGREKRG